MKFRFFVFFQLLFLSMLRGETILYWNSPDSLSDKQVASLVEQISFHNPDLVCIRAENAELFEEIVCASHPHLFYDERLIVAGKNPITDLQFAPFSFNEANEGILEFITADNRIYIPIFNDPKDQVLWELTFQKIWDDHDPLSLLYTHSNVISQLQPINFICNSPGETLLCGGPSTIHLSHEDANGKQILEAKLKVESRETSGGGKVQGEVSGSISRDREGNISHKVTGTVTLTPSAK